MRRGGYLVEDRHSSMEIKYYATLRDITKRKDEIWSSPVSTLEELIRLLCEKYGKPFAKWVSREDGGFGSLSIFLVNGLDYRSLNGLQTKLSESDTISIFPPIAGG
jgi:sulfur-carrier protein